MIQRPYSIPQIIRPITLCILVAIALLIPASPLYAAPFMQKKSMQDQQLINILFIGNSYTYFNDMPKMLQTLINENPNSPIRADVRHLTAGGANFYFHAKRAITQTTLREKKWHFVILQNQSSWFASTGRVQNGLANGKKLADMVRENGAIPIIFQTWPKEPGSRYYKQKDPYLGNFSYSYQKLKQHTMDLGIYIGADVVPVGQYWATVMKLAPSFSLYADGSHPNNAGSYLTALAFYEYIIGEALVTPDIDLKPNYGLSVDLIKFLQNVVAQPVQP